MKSNKPYIMSGVLMGVLLLVASCKSTPPPALDARVSGSATEMGSVLREVIPEQDRLEALLLLATEAEALLEQGATDLAEMQQAQQALLADYQSTREDFAKIGAEMDARRADLFTAVWAIRQRIAAQTTDEEWKEITSRDEALFKIWGMPI
jgi:hypothetical protein